MEAVLVSFAALILAALIWLISDNWDRGRLLLKREVIINLHSGKAVKGVVITRRGRWLSVRNATVMVGSETSKADGEIIIDRDEIDFIQAVG